VQVRRGENMRLVLFHACGRETVPDGAARHPQRRRVGYDDGPFAGKQFPEHIAGLGQDAGPDTQRFGFRGVGQRVFYSVHIVVFCVCLSVRRSVVVPLLLPVRAFCRSVVAVADIRDGFPVGSMRREFLFLSESKDNETKRNMREGGPKRKMAQQSFVFCVQRGKISYICPELVFSVSPGTGNEEGTGCESRTVPQL